MPKKLSLKLALFLFLTIFIFIGAGCKKSPEDIINEMRKSMAEAETFHYELSAEISGKGADLPGVLSGSLARQPDSGELAVGKIGIQLSGDANFKNLKNADSSSRAKIVFTSGGTELTVDMDSMQVDNVGYIKINTAPNLGFLNLNNLSGQWYKFNIESWQNGTLVPDGSLQENINLTPEQEQQVKDLIRKTKFFNFKNDLGKENIRGIKTYHYLVALDKAALRRFVVEYEKIVGEGMSEEKIKKLDDNLRKITEVEAELWIGVKDKLLYKIKIADLKFTDNKSADLKIDFTADLSEFNKKIRVEAPTGVRPSEEIFGDLFGPPGKKGGASNESKFNIDAIYPSGVELPDNIAPPDMNFSPDFDEKEFQKNLEEFNKAVESLQNNGSL